MDAIVVILRESERLVVAACVPLLLYIGFRLFAQGSRRLMQASVGATSKWKLSISNLSPGALCFLLAAALGAYIMFSRVTHSTVSPTPTLPAIVSPPNPAARPVPEQSVTFW